MLQIIYIYNLWCNSISLQKDKMSFILTFSDGSFLLFALNKTLPNES